MREEKINHPGEVIRKILREYKSPKVEGMPTFTGGLVGYFSYDYVKYGEPVLQGNDFLERGEETERLSEDEPFPDVDLMLFDKVIAFDQFRQKILLIDNVRLDDLESDYKRAEASLKEMEKMCIRDRLSSRFHILREDECVPW